MRDQDARLRQLWVWEQLGLSVYLSLKLLRCQGVLVI